MAIDEVKPSGTTWTVEDLHNGRVVGGGYYSNDRNQMPGGSVDAGYCWRVSKNQCIDLGIGIFGTRGKDSHIGRRENTMVPNLHFGTTFLVDRILGLGLLGRVGAASMRGKTGFPNNEAFRQEGVYLEGVFRVLGNTSHHRFLGTALFLDGGVASFPGAASVKRDAGFLIRSGLMVTFGRPKATQ